MTALQILYKTSKPLLLMSSFRLSARPTLVQSHFLTTKSENTSSKSSLIFSTRQVNVKSSLPYIKNSTFVRFYTAETAAKEGAESTAKAAKKPSKFKQFYSQYGPLFIVIHLTTVVLWIYGFFLLSKQGYDITQVLHVFHKLNIMSKETIHSIHDKISNYKTESGWITGNDIKHFATAYMIYKVIAPFRYMVSIAIVRQVVTLLRAKKILKT